MGRLRQSVRYRRTARPATAENKAPAARIMARPCGVAGCGNNIDRQDYFLCPKHYKALPTNLQRALTDSQGRDAQARGLALVAALDCLDAMQGQMTALFLDDYELLYLCTTSASSHRQAASRPEGWFNSDLGRAENAELERLLLALPNKEMPR